MKGETPKEEPVASLRSSLFFNGVGPIVFSQRREMMLKVQEFQEMVQV